MPFLARLAAVASPVRAASAPARSGTRRVATPTAVGSSRTLPWPRSRGRRALTVTAYAGDAKTLLAFDLTKAAAKDPAGFTIQCEPAGNPSMGAPTCSRPASKGSRPRAAIPTRIARNRVRRRPNNSLRYLPEHLRIAGQAVCAVAGADARPARSAMPSETTATATLSDVCCTNQNEMKLHSQAPYQGEGHGALTA
jgi:hypothetical protein